MQAPRGPLGHDEDGAGKNDENDEDYKGAVRNKIRTGAGWQGWL